MKDLQHIADLITECKKTLAQRSLREAELQKKIEEIENSKTQEQKEAEYIEKEKKRKQEKDLYLDNILKLSNVPLRYLNSSFDNFNICDKKYVDIINDLKTFCTAMTNSFIFHYGVILPTNAFELL